MPNPPGAYWGEGWGARAPPWACPLYDLPLLVDYIDNISIEEVLKIFVDKNPKFLNLIGGSFIKAFIIYLLNSVFSLFIHLFKTYNIKIIFNHLLARFKMIDLGYILKTLLNY